MLCMGEEPINKFDQNIQYLSRKKVQQSENISTLWRTSVDKETSNRAIGNYPHFLIRRVKWLVICAYVLWDYQVVSLLAMWIDDRLQKENALFLFSSKSDYWNFNCIFKPQWTCHLLHKAFHYQSNWKHSLPFAPFRNTLFLMPT